MITNRNSAKTMVKQISSDFKCKINSRICNSNQKWNDYIRQWECKKYRK